MPPIPSNPSKTNLPLIESIKEDNLDDSNTQLNLPMQQT